MNPSFVPPYSLIKPGYICHLKVHPFFQPLLLHTAQSRSQCHWICPCTVISGATFQIVQKPPEPQQKLSNSQTECVEAVTTFLHGFLSAVGQCE